MNDRNSFDPPCLCRVAKTAGQGEEAGMMTRHSYLTAHQKNDFLGLDGHGFSTS